MRIDYRTAVPAMLLTLFGLPAVAQEPPGATSALSTCSQARVTLIDSVDSATARVGDIFHFKTLNDVTVAGHHVLGGTVGIGTVAVANHARGGGRAGNLVLDTRSVIAEDGTRVPISLQPIRPEAAARGGTSNAPAVLSFVPGIGAGAAIYNAVHHGKDATIMSGTYLVVYVNSDAPSQDCTVATR